MVVLVCGGLFLSKNDEEIILQTIYRAVMEKDKGFIAWMKNGRLTVDTDVLAKLMMPPSSPSRGGAQGQSNVPLYPFDRRRHVEQPKERKPGYEWENENLQQQRVSLPEAATATNNTEQNPLIGRLVLKSKLRYGRISFDSRDVKFMSEGLWAFPEDIVQHLLERYQHIHERQVKIMLVPSHNRHLCYVGDEEIEMADNDLLLLQTRVRNGLVSLHEDDIVFHFPGDWQVPMVILSDLKRTALNGKLFIISDEKGNLRWIVKRAENKFKEAVAGVRDMVLAVWPF